MNIVIMLFLISLLILVHELGHFISARMVGIKVEKFGFGLPFGPTLFKTKIKDVEVLIHAFLLGGYVSFPDDDPENRDKKNPEDLFRNKAVWKRVIVVSAGVIANMICAFFLILLTASVWHKLPSGKYDIFVNKIVAEKTASVHQSGLREGDKIVKINGSEIFHPLQVNSFSEKSKYHDGIVSNETYQERLEELQKLNPSITDTETPVTKGVTVNIPISKDEEKVVMNKAELLGIEKTKKDDIKLSKKQITLRNKLETEKTFVADGETTLSDIAKAISDTKKPLYYTVMRDGKEVDLKPMYANEKGLIGIENRYVELVLPAKTFVEAIKNSCIYTYQKTELTLYGLGMLFTGQIPVKELHGIVAITKVGGDMIEKSGLFNGFLLTAIISINLAVMNLLPIPALDGGHLMFLIIEKIKGKPLDEEVVGKISNIFFLLLIILMLLIVFNDVFALVTKKI